MAKKTRKAEEKKQENKEKAKVIKANFTGESVVSNTKEAMDLYGSSRFGEIIGGKVHYSIPEALYLLEKGRLQIMHKKKKLKFEKFMQEALEIDKKIRTKYLVFFDLRSRGYIVKTALKFGAEFRVYSKGVKPGEDHAKWVLFPVNESQEFSWHDFAAKNRVAHATKKNLLIAIVDEEGDVTYYEISWIRP